MTSEHKEKEFPTTLTTDDFDCMSPEEAANLYKGICSKFDKEMTVSGYGGPLLCAQYLDKHASALGWKKEEVRILDVAAGTGAVGQALKCQYGYVNLDAVDFSQAMLDEARRKNIYQKLICSAVGGGVTMPIPDDTYDGIAISGGFIEGHLKCDALLDMIRVIKPGGLYVNAMRHKATKTCSELARLLPFFDQLVKEGKLKKLEQIIIPEIYYMGHDGLLQVYQVL